MSRTPRVDLQPHGSRFPFQSLMRLLRRSSLLPLALRFLAAGQSQSRADPALIGHFQTVRAVDELDGMVKRRYVRALVIYSKIFYFVDRGRERGLIAEGVQLFERHLNRSLATRTPQYLQVLREL